MPDDDYDRPDPDDSEPTLRLIADPPKDDYNRDGNDYECDDDHNKDDD